MEIPYNRYALELLTVVLENNYFEFNRKHFHQIAGSVMGSKLAQSYADIFVTQFEDKHVYMYLLQPFLWKRLR